MKIFTTIFLFSLANLAMSETAISNGLGQVDRKHKIPLSENQICSLRRLVYDQNGHFISKNFPVAYRYIYRQIKAIPTTDQGTLFWFEKAASINKNAGSSSYMIRTYTKIGLQLANRASTDLQKVSDDIAENVIGDVIKSQGVPPLQNILSKDITAAMKIGNIKDLAGWGGSFYYWHMPLVDENNNLIKDPTTKIANDYLTVGDSILRDLDQRSRFIIASILSMSSTPYWKALSDSFGLLKALEAISKLPDEVRLPIIEGISDIDPMMGSVLSLATD